MADLDKVLTLERSEKRFARLVALPGMIVLVLLVAGPLIYMLVNSFFLKTLATPLPPRFNWGRNYVDLFTDGRFWNAFLNTMIIMVIGIPVQSVLALIIALLLNKRFPGSKIVIGSIRTGKTTELCESRASRSREPNTHPHAYLTPDLKWVIFNSDRGGFPHVYAASVTKEMLERVDEA